MNRSCETPSGWILIACLFAVTLLTSMVATPAIAQQMPDQFADQVLAEQPTPPRPVADVQPEATSLNLVQLIWTARWLMIPIILMSVIVVAIGLERMVTLRRNRMMPSVLLDEIDDHTSSRGAFNARHLYNVANDFPSPTANVLKVFLHKVGRPHAEVERAVGESMQQEAERLYRNVRTLNLAATVTPLMGLLGTVWGMIEAFFATANLPLGANKAESLAEGIYTALVTTAGGLVVAIPAAILAHWFEGHIERIFNDIHDLVYTRLMPVAERMEGVNGQPRKQPAKKGVTNPTPPPVGRSMKVE
jgi:biopolymer transport protein ExbB